MFSALSNFRLSSRLAAVALVLGASVAAQAASVKVNSLESLLVNPDPMTKGNMYGLWVGSGTQEYEYNMPFVELVNETTDLYDISGFRLTIGSENHHFSNEFKHKSMTNSWDLPADGGYALVGKSTPDMTFTSQVLDGGRELYILFDTPLEPGETARFQVDINTNDDAPVTYSSFEPFTSVFFTPNGGADTTGNASVVLERVGQDDTPAQFFPNIELASGQIPSISTPRPYNTMQTPLPGGSPGLGIFNGEIPEPASLLSVLAAMAVTAVARRR